MPRFQCLQDWHWDKWTQCSVHIHQELAAVPPEFTDSFEKPIHWTRLSTEFNTAQWTTQTHDLSINHAEVTDHHWRQKAWEIKSTLNKCRVKKFTHNGPSFVSIRHKAKKSKIGCETQGVRCSQSTTDLNQIKVNMTFPEKLSTAPSDGYRKYPGW